MEGENMTPTGDDCGCRYPSEDGAACDHIHFCAEEGHVDLRVQGFDAGAVIERASSPDVWAEGWRPADAWSEWDEGAGDA